MTKRFNLVVVGNLTIDQIVFDEEERQEMGGPPAYAMVAPALGAEKVGIVSNVGSNFPKNYLSQLTNAGLDISGIIHQEDTTQFVNKYNKDGTRTQEVLTVGHDITITDIPAHFWDSQWMHISPVLQEVESSLITRAKQTGMYVSVDVQGFVRKRTSEQDHSISPCQWQSFPDVAKDIDVLKADLDEICHLTKQTTFEKGAEVAHEMGCDFVLITCGQEGSFLYSNDGLHEIPAIPPDIVVDHTGSGDVFAISFGIEFQRTLRPLWSAFFASSSASFNVETPGPTNFPTAEEVTNRLRAFLFDSAQQKNVELLLNETGPFDCPLK
ncbi:MAG: carbohydrate kinase family protein [Candidatus Hermodarchaeota archaeon]